MGVDKQDSLPLSTGLEGVIVHFGLALPSSIANVVTAVSALARVCATPSCVLRERTMLARQGGAI